MLEWNRSGKKPATLEENHVEEKPVGGPLNSDLENLDKKFKDKSKKKKKGHDRNRRDNRQKGNNNPNKGQRPNNGNNNNNPPRG